MSPWPSNSASPIPASQGGCQGPSFTLSALGAHPDIWCPWPGSGSWGFGDNFFVLHAHTFRFSGHTKMMGDSVSPWPNANTTGHSAAQPPCFSSGLVHLLTTSATEDWRVPPVLRQPGFWSQKVLSLKPVTSVCWAQHKKTGQGNINQPSRKGGVCVCVRARQSGNRIMSSSLRNQHQEQGMEGGRNGGSEDTVPWLRRMKRWGFCLPSSLL